MRENDLKSKSIDLEKVDHGTSFDKEDQDLSKEDNMANTDFCKIIYLFDYIILFMKLDSSQAKTGLNSVSKLLTKEYVKDKYRLRPKLSNQNSNKSTSKR